MGYSAKYLSLLSTKTVTILEPGFIVLAISIAAHTLAPDRPHYIFSRKTYVKESYNGFYLEETYRLEHFCYARIIEVTGDFLRQRLL